MISISYIISKIDKAVAFEWIIQEIDSKKYKLSFILLNNEASELEKFIQKAGINFFRIPFQSKKDYPQAIIQTRRKLKVLGSQVVHCHMRDANFIGLTAAISLGIKKRIYTRHFSTFNHLYFPKAVKYDRFVNYMATDIVAISKNIQNILIEKENVSSKKISLIHHGFDLKKFGSTDPKKIDLLKQKYNPENKQPVIGVIARYINWKGLQYIIEAFSQVLKEYPNALFIFANASGPQKADIQKMLADYIPNNFIEIDFENDLFSLYKLFDIYVHTPINKEIEAFGQTYIEALASCIPSVFTLSGVANEFIKDRENAMVVPHENSSDIAKSILQLMQDDDLKNKIIKNGKMSVSHFGLTSFISKLEILYA